MRPPRAHSNACSLPSLTCPPPRPHHANVHPTTHTVDPTPTPYTHPHSKPRPTLPYTHPTLHPPYPTSTPTTPTLLYTHTYPPPRRCLLAHRFGDPGVIERSPATCFPMPEEVAVRVRANQSLDDLSKCASFFLRFVLLKCVSFLICLGDLSKCVSAAPFWS